MRVHRVSPGLLEVGSPEGWTCWGQGWWEHFPGREGPEKGDKALGAWDWVHVSLGGSEARRPSPYWSISFVLLSPQVRAPAAHPLKRAGSGASPRGASMGGRDSRSGASLPPQSSRRLSGRSACRRSLGSLGDGGRLHLPAQHLGARAL